MILSAPVPFNLEHSLKSGQAHRWLFLDGWYSGVIAQTHVRLRQVPQGIEFFSGPMSEAEFRPLLHHYLGLEDDLARIYGHLGHDHRLAEAFGTYPGLRLLRQEPWECLITYLCTINCNIPRIGKMIESLCRRFGREVSAHGLTRFSFPDAASLAATNEQELRRLGLGFRASYVAAAAQRVHSGAVSLEALHSEPYEKARAILMAVPGVGEKVADCVLLYSLGKQEAFPVDVWVRRAVQDWYLGGTKATYKVIQQWASGHFRPYAGYAQLYLFYARRLQGRAKG